MVFSYNPIRNIHAKKIDDYAVEIELVMSNLHIG